MISGIGLYVKLCLDYHRHYLRHQLNLKLGRRFNENWKPIKSSFIPFDIYAFLGFPKNECNEKEKETCPRKFLICGNWKMNGCKSDIEHVICSLKRSREIDPNIDVIIAVPSLYLDTAKKHEGKNIYIAAQNCYKIPEGSFTGEISATMLRDIGIEWVILGDSVRRLTFKECDKLVGEKIEDALCDGLNVIACLLERKEDIKSGKSQEVIFRQLRAICESVDDWCEIILAYEPIWTFEEEITPEQVQAMHCQIREWLRKNVSETLATRTRIIYAGNVDCTNAARIAQQEDVDGFLIGEKSITEEFYHIITTKMKKVMEQHSRKI